ncbi:MAG: 3-dehydroquinate synthase [Firmicutes bacterium]|nr:3-dehydroquinate synthase [Bacillota bacterium]
MKKVFVNAGKGYEILIGSGLIAQVGSLAQKVLRAEKLAILTDSTVDPLYGSEVEKSLSEAGFDVCRYVFPAGEENKTIATVTDFINFMSDNRLTRKDAVVALGGGVVGDMGGFAAAIYLRGIDFIQIPTTLLAAVDSSVGGKTGVDIPNGKNLMGTFWQPSLVLYDIDTFKSLDQGLIMDGTAEIIKTAAIRDAELLELISSTEVADNLEEIVERCVTIKGQVVEADEKESGLRKILNFGHTMAHAIELNADYGISHGRAVAIGMLLITKAAEKQGLGPAGMYDRLYEIIKSKGFEAETDAPLELLCELASTDKKTSGDKISLVYLKDAGMAETVDVKLCNLYDFMR